MRKKRGGIVINITYSQILKDIKDRTFFACPELKKFKWYSYTHYKALFYMYVSVPLVYFFCKMNIKPNAITLMYIFLGIFAGACLAVNNVYFTYCGIIILFSRSILDWCDGMVAKYSGLRSLEGHCLDIYGAYSGWIALWTGLGFYCFHKTGYNFIVYTLPIVPLIFALDIKAFGRNILIDKSIADFENTLGEGVENINSTSPSVDDDKENIETEEHSSKQTVKNSIYNIINFINGIFFIHKARVVDFICLLIIVELNSKLNILWIYYLAFIVFHMLNFIMSFVYFLKGNFLKKEIKNIINNFSK